MKILVAFCLSLFLISCSKDGLISIPANLSGSVDFSITGSDPTSIDKTISVDAASVPALQSKLSLIKSYTIKTISYQIVNFSGISGTKLNGNITIGNVSIPVNNLALDQPTLYQISFTQDQLNAIAADLISGNDVTIKINGNINNKPTTFRLLFTIDVSVRV